MAKYRPQPKVKFKRIGVGGRKRGSGAQRGGRMRPTTKTQREDSLIRPKRKKRR